MKRFIFILSAILICGICTAKTIRWHVGDTVYTTSTCESGDNITPPTAPSKTGYTFQEWKKLYTRIEYLQSTGTQYIDTGVKFTGTTSRIDARYKLNLESMTDYAYTLSATQSGSNTRWGSLQYDKTIGKVTFTVGNVPGGSGILFSPSGSIDHAIYTTNGTSLTVEFNNNTQTISAGGSALTGQTLYLGCKNTSGTRSEYFIGNIYGYKLEIDGTLVRDFIPVLDYNGTPCMFDKVEGKFYYNAGTGDFIAGPVVSE